MNNYIQVEGNSYPLYRCCGVTTELNICMVCRNVLGQGGYNEKNCE